MLEQLYFKHSIIRSGNQDDVEKEINVFNDNYAEIVSVSVTPERVGNTVIQGCEFPNYIYHVCITYKERK